MVYDVSVRESFEELDSWISEAAKFGANLRELPTILCANKIDKRRVVTEAEGRQYAESRGLVYFETSASNGTNVIEVFDCIFQAVVRKARV